MKYILQVDFPHDGIFGKEMSAVFSDLAKDISQEEGLIWKIWTENESNKEAGGIYLFDNEEDANRYLKKHTERLTEFGYKGIRAKIFAVNEALSRLTKADI